MSNGNVADCPGTGRCHACASWCDNCGDVGKVCDDTSRSCMCHFCPTCGRLELIRDFACEACHGDTHRELLRHDIDREVAAFDAALDDGEMERADFLAARVLRLRRELAEVRP